MKKNGFTLIEILTVVVIIAILGAMVVPRFLLSLPEQALIGEAQQTLGVLRRALLKRSELIGEEGWNLTISSDNAQDMAKIGLQAITSPKFLYFCTGSLAPAGDYCEATRRDGTYLGNSIKLTADGFWTCSGYSPLSDQRGCTI